MPTVKDILNALWALAPAHYKEPWDNIGFLLGHRDAPVKKVLVALDATVAVAEEAARLGCELVVTHHPLIFEGFKSATDESPVGRRILALTERKIALISMHTNLDCAPNGVNDKLAEVLGLHNVTIFQDGETAGLVRMGDVTEQPLADFAAFVKSALHCPGLRYADGGKPVRRVAVGGGGCGDFAARVAAAGCDTFVTADLKYHQFADARALGINLIDAGHFETEDPVCDVVIDCLCRAFPTLEVYKSAVHTDCTQYL